MNVERDYDIAGPVLRLWWRLALLAAFLFLALSFAPKAEAQGSNICHPTKQVATSTALDATDAIMVVDGTCPADGSLYKGAKLASLLLLTGRVTEHATDCTAATATSPALCIEIDEVPPALYACELASGSICDTAGEWSAVGGGAADGVGYDEVLEEGAGLTKRAQVNFIGAGITCVDNGGATRTDCTVSAGADTGPSPDCAGTSTYQDGEGGCDAVGGDLSGGLDAAVVADNSHAHDTTTISGIVAADMGDADHGDGTWASGVFAVDSGAVGAGELGDDLTCAANEVLARNGADNGWDCVAATGTGDVTSVLGCAAGDCDPLTIGATGLLNLSGSDSSTTTEGLILPQHATACAGGTAEGQVCWEADDNTLYVGDGAALVAIGGGMVWAGNTAGATLATGATNYIPINGTMDPTATETNAAVPGPGISPTRFRCIAIASPGAGKSYAFTLRTIAGGDSDWTCTVADAATSCEDTSGSAIVGDNSYVVGVAPSGTPTARAARCSLEFTW